MADEKSPRDTERDPNSGAPPSLQGNHGTFSDAAPGLVAPTHLNQGDTGIASDKPEAGGALDFDDGDMIDGGRGGNKARTGGTWSAQGGDSAPLGPPAELFSDSNQPSDRSGAGGDGSPGDTGTDHGDGDGD
ncbi:MAG: hypothetical protein JWP47_2121 [Polaromonas sp.]|nr:hypothetical protein [Polaromonas sp.]